MNGGFVKLYRSIESWEWYTDSNTKSLFLHCLIRANHKPVNWRGTVIEQGSFVSSLESLSVDTGLSVREVRTSLGKLESTGEIIRVSTNRFTQITVAKWADFQGQDDDSDKQTTNKRQTNDKQNAKKVEKTTNQNSEEYGLYKADYDYCVVENDKQTTNKIDKTVENRQQTRSKEKNDKKNNKDIDVFVEYAGDNLSLLKALEDFDEMRKSIKKPMSDRARQILCSKLTDLSAQGENIIECLNESVLHSWQGVFPKKRERIQRNEPIPDYTPPKTDTVDIDTLKERLANLGKRTV